MSGECDKCGEHALECCCDEIFIKDFLRRIFIKNECVDSKDETYKSYMKLKKKIDPNFILAWTKEVAFEEFIIRSDNSHLSDTKS